MLHIWYVYCGLPSDYEQLRRIRSENIQVAKQRNSDRNQYVALHRMGTVFGHTSYVTDATWLWKYGRGQ